MFRDGLMAALAIIAVSGCAKNQASTAAPGPVMGTGMPGPGMMEAMGSGDCPAAVAGTTIASTDKADGMAMTFTNAAHAEEVRQRVRAMADRMNERSDAGAGTRAMMGGGGRDSGMPMDGMMGGDMMDGSMPAMQVRVEDTASGAILVMSPADPSKASAMRDGMRQHARMMSDPRGCP